MKFGGVIIILFAAGLGIFLFVICLFDHRLRLKLLNSGLSGDKLLNSRVTEEETHYSTLGDPSNAPCTFKLFRTYFRKYDYLPTGGAWVNQNGTLRYQPVICKFKYDGIDGIFISNSLQKANVTYIVTTGDSNGGHNFNSLVSLLQSGQQENCRKGRHDRGAFYPDRDYYTFYNKTLDQFLETRFRFCAHHCANRETFCKTTNNSELLLEHIATTMTLDDSVQLSIPKTVYYGDHLGDTWALTNQEYVLRYYLKDRYPDVLIITLPFNHDKHIALRRFRFDIDYFTDLVEYYVPRSTKIFYLPSFMEFESTRTRPTWVNRTFENVLAAEKINQMNHLLYSIIKDDIVSENGRTYGFIDLWEMSRTRESWSIDGIHMKPEWYQNVMAMFWETFCNSVHMDGF